ncbi:hypothetical protein GYH30_035313 [Glycine max]|nr:hypothetical protein GYH30_035313 [Glycine max]
MRPFFANSIIVAYVQNGDLHDTFHHFATVPGKNIASYNVMISGLARCKHMEDVQRLFEAMPCPNIVSYTVMVDGYARVEGGIGRERMLFKGMPRRNAINNTEKLCNNGDWNLKP